MDRALADPDADVRLAAAAAARQLAHRGASAHVVPWLSDSDQRLRVAAAELLAWSPNPRAITALGRALADPDPLVRGLAARALGASGQPEATLPLLGHLDDSAPQVRRDVVLALGRLADARAVVPLIGKIQDGRPEVRRAVVFALGELGDVRAASALVLSLRDNEDAVRIAALEALGRLGDPQSALAIETVAAQDDVPAPVRAAALASLAQLGSPQALDRVVQALARDDSREAALQALTTAGTAAAKRLEACVKSESNSEIADGCALALAQLGRPAAAALVREAMRRGNVSPTAGLPALGQLGASAYLPVVLEYLESKDGALRRIAMAAAGDLLDPAKPDGRAVEPLRRALSRADAGSTEFVSLVHLLGRSGSARAAPVLVPLAEHSDNVHVQSVALEALGHTSGPGADRALLAALDAEEAPVRMAAAVALWRAGTGATARLLLERVERAAEQDRVAVALALSGALSRTKSKDDVLRAARVLQGSRGGQRDALIEALARSPGGAGLERLGELARASVDAADRAKIAECVASRSDALPLLRSLSTDVDAAVRANALWALGWVGTRDDVSALAKAIKDRDAAAANDAAVSLGRLGKRLSLEADVQRSLCASLGSVRSAVRSGALHGLRLAGARCGEEERRLLSQDDAEAVRIAAAMLLAEVPSKDLAKDKRALAHCVAEEVSSAVAVRCLPAPGRAAPKGAQAQPIGVFVVPVGQSAPVAGASYALRLADGSVRVGRADRRGQVLELNAPPGEVSLVAVDELLR